jgi:hypothetical protein
LVSCASAGAQSPATSSPATAIRAAVICRP